MEIPLQQIIQFHSLPVCLCESIRFSPWPMAQTNLIYNPDKNVPTYSPFMRSFWKNTRSYRTLEVMMYMILVLVSGVSHNTILLNQTVSLEEIKNPLYEGFSVTRKYIFQLGGIAPFKGYAVFSYLSVSFCSVCGSVGKWISPTKLKIISTFWKRLPSIFSGA